MNPFEEVERIMLPPQKELLYAKEPFTAYVGGVGSGKTIGGAIKGLEIQANYPGAWGMVTAPSHNVLNGATIPVYEEIFTSHYIKSFNRQSKEMTLIDGGKVLFRTTKEPWLLEGPSLAWFHMDEASKSPVLAFQNLQARLRQTIELDGKRVYTPMQGWITTSPRGFANWIYWEFGKEERANYRLINTATKDNFLAPKQYLEHLIESYSHDPQFAIQQLDGKFIQVGGACPFDMEILNTMYEEAKEGKALRKELDWIYIYHERVIGHCYIIGADAATGIGDDESAFVCAQVSPVSIDPVCCGRAKVPEVEFADILYRKSQEYNDALIVKGASPVGKATLIKLEELGANVLKTKDKLGVVESPTTKPMLVEGLREAIKDRTLPIPHLDILEQLMSYIRDEKGRFGAVSGAHDDYVSALMMLVYGIKEIPMMDEIRVIDTLV